MAMAPMAGAALGSLGPWMAASAGIQGIAGLFGGSQQRAAAQDAINAAEEAKVRDWGMNMFMMERDKAKQMEGIREGLGIMQSPIFQQNKAQEFGKEAALAGKYGFNPYIAAQTVRLFGG